MIPRWGYVKGLGLCQVLAYLGDDRFDLLDKRDRRWIRHRSLINFRKR